MPERSGARDGVSGGEGRSTRRCVGRRVGRSKVLVGEARQCCVVVDLGKEEGRVYDVVS